MKKITDMLSDKLKNLPLQGKAMLLVIFILVFTSAGSILGFRLIFDSGNRMLYESLAASLSYSSSVFSEKMQAIESMTYIMLSDSTIQNTLTIVSDEQDDGKRNDAYRTLSYLVPGYYQNFKQNGIRYMNLYNNNYVTYSYLSRSKGTPELVHETVIEAAHLYSGAPVWVTDYCNEYGLFLGRDIRRAAQLKLDTLGTIVVSVDLGEMINTSTQNMFQSEKARYVFYHNGNEIYHSPELGQSEVMDLSQKAEDSYGVIRVSGSPFFYVKGIVPYYGWEYICLSSYDTIARAQSLYVWLSILIILTVFIASILMSRKIICSITNHFKRLLDKMADFGQNESVLPVTDYDYAGRSDEIGELHLRFDQMALKVQNLIQKNYVNELLTKEAQLKALENQMNPHFLYNTLESINWQAKAIGSKEISTMVEALGALLRTTLNQKESISTIRNELDIVNYYMTIIKIRFDERIQYTNDVPEMLYPYILPQLTLQPLVENAVNYAMEEITETCSIQITGYADGHTGVIKVKNSGSQFPDNLLEGLMEETIQPHGFGIGLINIHKRLKLYFGPDYDLQLFNEEGDYDEYAIVQITFPIV